MGELLDGMESSYYPAFVSMRQLVNGGKGQTLHCRLIPKPQNTFTHDLLLNNTNPINSKCVVFLLYSTGGSKGH